MPDRKTYSATVDGHEYVVDVERADGSCRISVDGGATQEADFFTKGAVRQFSLLLDHCSYEGMAHINGEGLKLWVEGEPFEVQVMDQRLKALSGGRVGGGGPVQTLFKTPMPGIVVTVHVEAGQEVTKGQPILTLEAMKMRNDLKATRDGVIGRVAVSAGQTVAKGDVLVEFAA
ncbi:MAG: biotin/lipoyl-binding protein [Gaiellales bacterium]|nr:biotin/lipoyl-binding protein [Gaiellales bacterium]